MKQSSVYYVQIIWLSNHLTLNYKNYSVLLEALFDNPDEIWGDLLKQAFHTRVWITGEITYFISKRSTRIPVSFKTIDGISSGYHSKVFCPSRLSFWRNVFAPHPLHNALSRRQQRQRDEDNKASNSHCTMEFRVPLCYFLLECQHSAKRYRSCTWPVVNIYNYSFKKNIDIWAWNWQSFILIY